jgi:prevent-host-death family protein
MASYNVHEAKSSLSKLLKEAEEGREVIIMRNGEPVAKLVRCRRARPKKIKLGFAAGLVKEIDPDWWKPMSDEEVDALFGGKF